MFNRSPYSLFISFFLIACFSLGSFATTSSDNPAFIEHAENGDLNVIETDGNINDFNKQRLIDMRDSLIKEATVTLATLMAIEGAKVAFGPLMAIVIVHSFITLSLGSQVANPAQPHLAPMLLPPAG